MQTNVHGQSYSIRNNEYYDIFSFESHLFRVFKVIKIVHNNNNNGPLSFKVIFSTQNTLFHVPEACKIAYFLASQGPHYKFDCLHKNILQFCTEYQE